MCGANELVGSGADPGANCMVVLLVCSAGW